MYLNLKDKVLPIALFYYSDVSYDNISRSITFDAGGLGFIYEGEVYYNMNRETFAFFSTYEIRGGIVVHLKNSKGNIIHLNSNQLKSNTKFCTVSKEKIEEHLKCANEEYIKSLDNYSQQVLKESLFNFALEKKDKNLFMAISNEPLVTKSK